MRSMLRLLGNGLLKKEIFFPRGTLSKKERQLEIKRKKISDELFLRNILGCHLIEKKSNSKNNN